MANGRAAPSAPAHDERRSGRGKTVRSGAGHQVMRELNRSLVLDVLRQSSPISRADISRATSLAKPTVSAIVDDLIDDELILEIGAGKSASGGGRPPSMLEFNARSSYVVGVQIGVHTTTIVVADALGREVARAARKTSRKRPVWMLTRIAEEIESLVAALDDASPHVSAVGVCVPGLVDREHGICKLAPNLGWQDVAIGPRLQERLGLHVVVHNTSQAAAVAEWTEGAGIGTRDMVFIYVGSGLGMGVFVDGRLHYGSRGMTGEIGHCRVEAVTEPCNCGKVGCLETVASGPALSRAAQVALASGAQTVLSNAESLEPEHIAAAAAGGDVVARDLVANVARHLGIGASWLVNLFNPELVVVGGGLVEAGEVLLDPLREAMLQESLPQLAEEVRFAVSELGQDAEIRGALLLAMSSAEEYHRLLVQA